MNNPRIDVHAHFLPDFYREALVKAGQIHPDGMPTIPDWSEQAAFEAMDKLGIATAMLSISSPGVYFGDAQAASELTRRVNEEGARLRDIHPDRFGWFASTSLPDVASAVEQAVYALDTLSADGIVLETNHDGLYLGDRTLDPLYEVLNDRKSVLFLHPTSPKCLGCGLLTLGFPDPLIEFLFDTTRSVMQMMLSGVTVRYPEIRIIVPHAGAALPILASRIDLLIPFFELNSPVKSSRIRDEMRKLYYDLAGAPLPELLPALLSIADPDHILYGSDWPFTQLNSCLELSAKLDNSSAPDSSLNQDFMLGNALRLFPRLTQKEGTS